MGRLGKEMRRQITNRRGGGGVSQKKGGGKPSSEHISGKRKVWLSLRETTDGRGNDTGARSGNPWYRCPYMQEAKAVRQGV